MRVFLMLAATGCAAKLDGSAELTAEPAAIEVTIAPGHAAPTVPVHVLDDGVDVTSEASFVLTGAQVGGVVPGLFTSDGKTGGSASIGISVHGGFITVPVHARVESVRLEDGLGSAVAGMFTGVPDLRVDAQLEP